MKKLLAMLLALVLLLSLCACNSAETPETDPAEEMTQNTEATNEGGEEATEESQGATEQMTDPTEAPVPTEAPTAPAPTAPAPAPAGCSHSWKAATCTAAKTCTKCGATEGGAAGHNYKAATCSAPKTCTVCGATEGAAIDHNYANGACSMCGAAAPKSAYDEFVENVWKCAVVKPATADVCETYFVVTYDPGWDFGYSYKSYYSELPEREGEDDDGESPQHFGTVEYNGKTYYDLTFSGSMGGWECEAMANGNVKIEMMNDVTLEVKRDAPGKFSIVSINDATFLPVGAVLNQIRAAE